MIQSLDSWMAFLAANSVLAAVVFCVVLLVTARMARRNPALHVALWSLVMIRLVLPPGLGHPLAVGALVERLVHSAAAAPTASGPAGHEAVLSSAGIRNLDRNRLAGSNAGLLTVAGLWLAGVIVVGSIQLRRRWSVHQVLGRALQSDDSAVLGACECWRLRLGVRRAVRVVTSRSGTAPFTIGVVRPLIYLPQGVAEDPGCMEAAIAHEMAHIARFDALWLGLQNVLQTVFFFNPVVWIAGARLNRAREQLCDATVVAVGRLAARDYVGGLLNVLRLELRGTGAPTMSARTRRIGMRVRNIFEREGGPRPTVGAAVFATAVLGVFLLPLGAGSAGGPTAETEAAVAQTGPELEMPRDVAFVNPLADGRVTWAWGPGHRDPFTGKEVAHRGIDLAAAAGTPVISPADGVVLVATESYEVSPASGTVVLIDHGNGLETFYAHLGSISVSEGETIAAGAVVATVGSTGKSTGPHLHFEVRRDGEVVNPADFVNEWK